MNIVPGLHSALISIPKLADAGYTTVFSKDGACEDIADVRLNERSVNDGVNRKSVLLLLKATTRVSKR